MCDAMLPALAQAFDTRPADAAGTVSAFALAYGLMQLVYGPLGDKFGKPQVIAIAAWGCAGAALASGLAPTLQWLSAGRMLMGAFAAGIIPLTMAWIGDRVPFEQRQQTLARLLTWTVLGMMLGAWAGGALAQVAGWRSAFFGVAAIFVVPGVAVARAAGRDPPQTAHPGAASFRVQVGQLLRSAWTRWVLAVVFVEGALVFGSVAFVPTILHQQFQLTLVEAGGALVLFALGGLVYSRIGPRLLQRLGAPGLARAGAIVLALSFAMLAGMTHWLVAAAACLLAGFGYYMLHNTLQACATQLSSTARGTGVSLFVVALFLGQAAGVAAAGVVIARFSHTVWFVGGALAVLATGAVFARALHTRLAAKDDFA